MSTNSLTDQVECKDLPGDSRATGRWLNIRTGGKVGDHCDPIGALGDHCDPIGAPAGS